MVDTDWPAKKPDTLNNTPTSYRYSEKLCSCITYIANDAQKHGFGDVARELRQILKKFNSTSPEG